jgi:hypothetical protein
LLKVMLFRIISRRDLAIQFPCGILAFYIRNQTNTCAFSSNFLHNFSDSSHNFLPSNSS